jgi:hypothetical protein
MWDFNQLNPIMRIGTGSANAFPTPVLLVWDLTFPFAAKKWLTCTFAPPKENAHTQDIFFFFIKSG